MSKFNDEIANFLEKYKDNPLLSGANKKYVDAVKKQIDSGVDLLEQLKKEVSDEKVLKQINDVAESFGINTKGDLSKKDKKK